MIPRRYVCHGLAALFCLTFVIPLVVMYRDNDVPVVIQTSAIVPPTVHPGQIVVLEWIAVEKRSCEGIIYRQFVDGAGVVHNMVSTPTLYRDPETLGRAKTFRREIQIPYGIAPGPALFSGFRRYWCNPLQRMLEGQFGAEIRVPAPLIRFEVVRPEVDDHPPLLSP